MYAAVSNRKWKMEAQAIFLNLFTVSSLNKWKFVVSPIVNEEMKGSYLFANRLNGFAQLSQVDGLNMYSRKSKQPSMCQTGRAVILISTSVWCHTDELTARQEMALQHQGHSQDVTKIGHR